MIGSSTTPLFTNIRNQEPISILLNYCKVKFLQPYGIILSIVSLKPLSTDITKYRIFFSFIYSILITGLLISGYFFKYLQTTLNWSDSINNHTSTYKDNCFEPLLPWAFIVSSLLDLFSFITAVIVFKYMDREQFQQLIERVFLLSKQPQRLCRTLWIFLIAYFIMGIIVYSHNIKMNFRQEIFNNWLVDFNKSQQISIKILILVSLFIQDFAKILIISGYCIKCYLLKAHLTTLSKNFLMHTMDSMHWMREIMEFRKLLVHLNKRVAIPICFLIILIGTHCLASVRFIWCLNLQICYQDDKTATKNLLFGHLINLSCWLILGWILPFIMAASLTQTCYDLKSQGHQIRVRPFVYHGSTADNLNSILIFVSTLDLSVQLFLMPIQYNYLCFILLIVVMSILTLGFYMGNIK